MKLKNILPAAAVVLAFAAPQAVDAASEQATASANIAAAIQIAKNSDLSFGTVIASASTGTVQISQAGARTASGVTEVPGGSISQASFAISGEENASYSITLNPSGTLTLDGTGTASGSSMTATLDPSVDVTQSQTLGSSATTLDIGATLNVGANQASGPYSTTFDVTVAYD